MFKRLIYKIKKPYLLIAERDKNKLFFKTLKLVLKGKQFVVFPLDKKGLEFYIKNSKKTVFIPKNQEKLEPLEQKLAKLLTNSDVLIKACKTKKIKTKAIVVEYGFEREADLSVSDLSTRNGFTNLKLNYQGNTVPLWLGGKWSKKELKKVIKAILVCLQLEVNLVDASQTLKNLEK